MAGLSNLCLSNRSLTTESLENIRQLAEVCDCQSLDLSKNVLTELCALPSRILVLDISFNMVRGLVGAESMPHLRELNASNNQLSDMAGLQHNHQVREYVAR